MPSTCCVPGCVNRGGFNFPKEKSRRDIWIANVCRDIPGSSLWEPSDNHRVCENHFRPEDIFIKRAMNSDREWRTLDPSAVPIKPKGVKRPQVGKVRKGRLKRKRGPNREKQVRTL